MDKSLLETEQSVGNAHAKKSHCRIKSRSLKATVAVKDSSRVTYRLLWACRVTLGMVHFRSRSLTQSRVEIEASAMAYISRFHSESVREALVLISGRWRWYTLRKYLISTGTTEGLNI